jgi:beta-1,4-mannosyltransferase
MRTTVAMKKLLHFTAFIASITLPFFVTIGLLLLVSESANENNILTLFKAFWFTGALFVITNAVGLFYGSPWHKEQKAKAAFVGWNDQYTLVVSYVSRGENQEALRRAVVATRRVLIGLQVKHIIEVITDAPVQVGADIHIVVPKEYTTLNGAKYKARALHYATESRSRLYAIDYKTYILHLDEESVLTAEAIRGISAHVQRNDLSSVGQGEIKYNAHNYGNNLIITAVDAIRTGDDLGRFRLQYRLFKKPLFGMHGSFFVVPAVLEKTIGFDLGGKGSITEDAYFALIASDRGVRFYWIDGFIQEQSPFTILEVLKQRRRWITGLRLLMFDKAISLNQRLMLGFNMTLWRLAWIGPVVTLWNVLAGGSLVPGVVGYAAAITSGMVGVVYMVGAYRNVIGVGLHPLRQLQIWFTVGLLVPLSCVIEGIAVLYSIVRPVKVFEVVNKN